MASNKLNKPSTTKQVTVRETRVKEIIFDVNLDDIIGGDIPYTDFDRTVLRVTQYPYAEDTRSITRTITFSPVEKRGY